MSNRHTVTSPPQLGCLVTLRSLLVFLGWVHAYTLLYSLHFHLMSCPHLYATQDRLLASTLLCIMIDYVHPQRICIHI
jgi:hypothetical protein